MKVRSLLTVLAAVALLGTSAEAATFDVNSILDEPDGTVGDGLCSSAPSGVCTLRAGIMEANFDDTADTVNLPPGTYTLTVAGSGEDDSATGDLDILAPLTISGAGVDATIIDAAGIDRVVEVLRSDTDLTLDRLTLCGGSAVTSLSERGGGLLHHGRHLWLTRVRVTGNIANAGGGIEVAYGSVGSIEDSTFDSNQVADAGITNPHGPAIRSEGTLSLVRSTVTGNAAFTWSFSNIHVSNCSGDGFTVVNSTIANNFGGGISSLNCNTDARHVVIAGNDGRGLQFGSYDNRHTLTVGNSIIAGNTAGDCVITSGLPTFVRSLDGDDTCGLSAASGDLPATDPQLLPLRSWGGPTETMYPRPSSSPAIDAGAGAPTCELYDQRLHLRGNDGNGDGVPGCDMGAVEADDLLFFDDFETGTADEWSITTSAASFPADPAEGDIGLGIFKFST